MDKQSDQLQAYEDSFNAVKCNLHFFWNFKSLSIYTNSDKCGPLMKSECQLVRQQYLYYRLYIQRLNEQNFPSSELILMVSLETRFLTELKLKNCQINDQSLKMIQKAGWKFIKVARLDDNCITNVGVKIIILCKWKHLEELKLSKNPIKNKGVELLNKAHFPYMKFLVLSQCKLTDCCMRALKKNLLDQLSFLDISNNRMGNECFKLLLLSNALNLSSLNLSNDDLDQSSPMIYPIYLSKKKKELRKICIYLSEGMHFSYGNILHSFFPNAYQTFRHYVWQEDN